MMLYLHPLSMLKTGEDMAASVPENVLRNLQQQKSTKLGLIKQ